MAFRRKFRRFGGQRRRRRLPETYTIVECATCINVSRGTCVSPLIDAFPLMLMTLRKSAADATEIISPERKGVVVDAIKFQAEHSTDPCAWAQCSPLQSPNIPNLNFLQRVWEAIMVLPLSQGSDVAPAYLPNLTDGLQQADDVADRVLWKRISILPMFGPNESLPICQEETTIRDMGHGPVVVKSKANIDDRHGLFYVRNFVNDVVWGATNAPNCFLNCAAVGDTDKNIPVTFDAWFKIFYHGTQKQA